MPEFTHPGVFVEEDPSGIRPIDGVSTSVTGFVGVGRYGPVDTPVRLSSWAEFARTFGDPDDPQAGPLMKDGFLAHAVRGFFANGGSHCHVVRAADSGSLEPGSTGSRPSTRSESSAHRTAFRCPRLRERGSRRSSSRFARPMPIAWRSWTRRRT